MGFSIALSADGNTAILGGHLDDSVTNLMRNVVGCAANTNVALQRAALEESI